MWKKFMEVRCRECKWSGQHAALVDDKNQEVNMSEIKCGYDPSHFIEYRVAQVEEFDALREYTKQTYGFDPGATPTEEKGLSEEERRQQAETELKEAVCIGLCKWSLVNQAASSPQT